MLMSSLVSRSVQSLDFSDLPSDFGADKNDAHIDCKRMFKLGLYTMVMGWAMFQMAYVCFSTLRNVEGWQRARIGRLSNLYRSTPVIGNDDSFLFTMRGLLTSVSWLGKHTKSEITAMAVGISLLALCKKMEIPYCIVDGKFRFRTIVHQKSVAGLCLPTPKMKTRWNSTESWRPLRKMKTKWNSAEPCRPLRKMKTKWNSAEPCRPLRYEEYMNKWGGGRMGSKSQANTKDKKRVLAMEAAERMNETTYLVIIPVTLISS
nr:hypothetical protein [Tanacetum cinerariifolium]